MVQLFCKCPDITELDFSDFDTSDITYMEWSFNNLDGYLTMIIKLNKLNVSKIISLRKSFYKRKIIKIISYLYLKIFFKFLKSEVLLKGTQYT